MMTIENFKDKYIKIKSATLQSLFDDASQFDALKITGKQGCVAEEVSQTISAADIINAGWKVDLSEAVGLNNLLYQTTLKNIITGKDFSPLSAPIDLGYVGANCAGTGCTMQDYSAHFAPLFKTALDNFFTTLGLTTDVTIEFVGNVLVVKGLPSAFILTVAQYAVSSDVTPEEQPFYYASIDGDVFLTDETMYISPSFFSDTELLDDVYQIKVKYTKAGNAGFIEETMCAFIDVKTRCKVATLMKELLGGDFKKEVESLWILHYALVTGSNCGCNCDDLCKAYNDLLSLLDELINNPNTSTTDCGC